MAILKLHYQFRNYGSVKWQVGKGMDFAKWLSLHNVVRYQWS